MANRIGGVSGWAVYGRSWGFALFVAVMISWGMMNIIALVLERRTLLNPTNQFKAFYLGDLICLPGLVLVLHFLSHRVSSSHHWWQRSIWHVACLLIGIAVGLVFHHMEQASYSLPQLNSPTKLWHDIVVFPAFIYLLFSAAPVLFYASGGYVPRLAAIALIVVFIALNAYDGSHRVTGAHVDYNWSHLQPVNNSGPRH